jgi:hypothetical protein
MMNQSAVPPVRPSENLAPGARRQAEILYAEELLAWALRFGHERDLEAAVQEVVERAECHGCQAAAVTAAVTGQPIWRRAEKRLLVRMAHARPDAPAAPAAPLTRADTESCLDAIEGIEPMLPRGERAP